MVERRRIGQLAQDRLDPDRLDLGDPAGPDRRLDLGVGRVADRGPVREARDEAQVGDVAVAVGRRLGEDGEDRAPRAAGGAAARSAGRRRAGGGRAGPGRGGATAGSSRGAGRAACAGPERMIRRRRGGSPTASAGPHYPIGARATRKHAHATNCVMRHDAAGTARVPPVAREPRRRAVPRRGRHPAPPGRLKPPLAPHRRAADRKLPMTRTPFLFAVLSLALVGAGSRPAPPCGSTVQSARPSATSTPSARPTGVPPVHAARALNRSAERHSDGHGATPVLRAHVQRRHAVRRAASAATSARARSARRSRGSPAAAALARTIVQHVDQLAAAPRDPARAASAASASRAATAVDGRLRSRR